MMTEAIAKFVTAAGGDFIDVQSIVDGFNLSEGMKVSEFGCGSGHFSMLMAKKVGKDGRVYAMDIQEQPLEMVREKAKAEGLANVETVRGNLEVAGGSSLPDASLDLVLMANILFQNSKKGDIIREGKRVLKEGGRLVLVEWKKGGGGFGPADSMRTDEVVFKQLAQTEGLNFERNIDAGQFHLGLVFRR